MSNRAIPPSFSPFRRRNVGERERRLTMARRGHHQRGQRDKFLVIVDAPTGVVAPGLGAVGNKGTPCSAR